MNVDSLKPRPAIISGAKYFWMEFDTFTWLFYFKDYDNADRINYVHYSEVGVSVKMSKGEKTYGSFD